MVLKNSLPNRPSLLNDVPGTGTEASQVGCPHGVYILMEVTEKVKTKHQTDGRTPVGDKAMKGIYKGQGEDFEWGTDKRHDISSEVTSELRCEFFSALGFELSWRRQQPAV